MVFVVLLLLLAASAFFSGSETAFFSIDRPARHKLRGQDTIAARSVLALLERPRELLVAILFGNVLINVGYFSIAATLATELRAHPSLELLVHILAFISIIVLGEVMPKTLTLNAPILFAKLTAQPLALWQRLSRFLTEPLGWITGRSVRLLDRVLPPQGPLTNVELAQLVTLQGKDELLSPTLRDFLEDVLLLSQICVREIMTPRVDIRCFDITLGRQAFLDFVASHRHSKIPVHRGGDLDDIDGVLHLKEIIRHPTAPLEDFIEPAWFIPKTKRIEELLQEMLGRDASLAIVVDEYGGTAGLVTIEDVVEEIVGDISSQAAVEPLRAKSPRVFAVSGALSVREVNELLDLQLDGDGATTIAGLVARQLGRIPKEGDEVELAETRLRVTRVEKFRTRQVDLILARERQLDSSEELPTLKESMLREKDQ